MAGSELKSGTDYHELFDPKAFLSGYYFNPQGLQDLTKCCLKSLHQIYSEGKIKGNRVIEIGAGPTIYFLIPAAKWFNEIYISEYSKRNREEQMKWLAKDPESFDWQFFFRYFAEKDGKAEDWPQYEQRFRDKIKSVLPCDYHQSNPLHPETLGQFDAVCSSLALEADCKNLEQFGKAMQNIVSLVAPGGYFILYSILKCPFYVVGNVTFWSLPVSYEEVLEAVKETGLEVVYCIKDDCKVEGDIAPYDGGVMIVARKRPEP